MFERTAKRLATALTATALLGGCAPPPPPSAAPDEGFPRLQGEYLGQTPPGDEPELFAPGIVSTALFTRDVAMTPDGTEIYWTVALGPRFELSAIVSSRLREGRWSEPEVTEFAGSYRYMELEPTIAPDGSRLCFVTNRPKDGGDGEPGDTDVWFVDREGDAWGEAKNLGEPVSSAVPEYFPSLTREGTIYFTRENPDRSNDIYRARRTDGGYAEPEKLGPEVNAGPLRFNAWIAPDESYLILPIYGHEDGLGGADYFVVFRDEEDRWTPPIHMGSGVNSKNAQEYSGSVSPDGKYFFFMSGRMPPVEEVGERLTWKKLQEMYGTPGNGNSSIYWVDASFIEALRPQPEP